MSNENEITATESPKISSSEDVALMILTLRGWNAYRGETSAESVAAAYVDARQRRDAAAADIAVEAERKRKAAMQAAIADGLKTRLERGGIATAGMSEQAMRDAAKEIDARESAARARYQAEIQSRRKEQEQIENNRRSDFLFESANCPLRQTENLPMIDAGKNRAWTEVRDLLFGEGGKDGYLVALLGVSGTGKTQIAVSVIHRCCEAQADCQYIRAFDLFRELRRGFGKDSEISESDIADKFADPQLLVIDELHNRGETKYEINALTNLLDVRYAEKRDTILIANQGKDEFAAAIGDSVVSRIHERGECIVCQWPSYRKAGSWRKSK